MQCVILAGGLATRMRPITETIPKILIPVTGEPFVHHQLTWLRGRGVTNVLLSIGYKGTQVRDYVGDGSRWGLRVDYVDEGTELRGTGGALRLALDEGKLDPVFFVTYGDSYLPVDYTPIWNEFQDRDEAALMVVYKNNEQYDVSNVCLKNDSGGGALLQVSLYDKWITQKPADMLYIDYGLSLFRRETIESQIPANQKLDLAKVFHELSLQGELAAYEIKQRFYEIGSPQGLKDLEGFLSDT